MRWCSERTKGGTGLVLAAALLFLPLLVAAPAAAVTVDWVAQETTITMPDGAQVHMWVYVDQAAPTVWPPVIETVAGDTVTINLTNNLTEPTSVVINGQTATEAGAMVPTWTDGTMAPRGMNYTKRVRSFTHEAAPAAVNVVYEWGSVAPGTYLVQSGTHVAVQVPMGLYGVLKVDQSAGQAYPAAGAYDQEVILLFSEVDPEMHEAVELGIYATGGILPSTGKPYNTNVEYEPQYFLVNGQPFPGGTTHYNVGDPPQDVLVRFLNAGILTRAPTVVGSHWTVIAEDGSPYATGREQATLNLDAGKTLDALISVANTGYLPIYDRALGLTNANSLKGGFLTYLEAGPATGESELVVDLSGGTGTGTVIVDSVPGGLNCTTPDTCNQHYLQNTEVLLRAMPDAGSVFNSWTNCTPVTMDTCVVTLTDPSTTVTATFGEGVDHIAVFRGGNWFYDINGNDDWDGGDLGPLGYGLATDVPVAGDWDGDSFAEAGLFRDGQWFLDGNGNGFWDPTDPVGRLGRAGDRPVTGDWDGDGVTEVGVFRGGQWFLDDGDLTWDPQTDTFKRSFGKPGDIPVSGDWDGDGTTEIGVFRAGTWYLDFNGNGSWDTGIDQQWPLGQPGDLPVTGDWQGDGVTDIAVFQNGTWYFDVNNNGMWDPGDRTGGLGIPGDIPVAGNWQ